MTLMAPGQSNTRTFLQPGVLLFYWTRTSRSVLNLMGSVPEPGAHLELVADADEAQLPGLLLPVPTGTGVLEEAADEAVFGLAHQALKRRVQRVVVLLHKLGLRRGHRDQVRAEPDPELGSVEADPPSRSTRPPQSGG